MIAKGGFYPLTARDLILVRWHYHLASEESAIWTAPGIVDTPKPHDEACSKLPVENLSVSRAAAVS